ncbi:hypothetical protein [Nocardia sp. X0981]
MADEGAPVADSVTVDSVTGQLAMRLGAVGESAGAVMRRNVRDAAGGAETIALLIQVDEDGARRIAGPEPDDHAGHGAAERAENPAPGSRPGAGITSGFPAAADTSPPNPAPPDLPLPGPMPSGSAGTGADGPPVLVAEAPAAPTGSPDTREAPAGAREPAATAGSPPEAAETRSTAISAPGDPTGAPVSAGHTPWTSGPAPGGLDPAHTPGSTPWNSGTGSSMPYLPSMPGGMGSLTPQERPPRGAPWSRDRAGRNGTVFPRPRPEQPVAPGRTE